MLIFKQNISIWIIVTKQKNHFDIVLNGTQCSGSVSECPRDICNTGGCDKGCATAGCSWMGCPNGHTKKENQLCVLSRNNCEDGLKCVDQDNGRCNNDFGKCVKPGKRCRYKWSTLVLSN